jgi:hypothetical protein
MKNRRRLPLDDALARYWKNLVPMACIPSLMVIIGKYWLPSGWAGPLLGAFLFCACAIAAFPYFFRDAPYSFWRIAIVCFGAGCVPAFLVFAILSGIVRS